MDNQSQDTKSQEEQQEALKQMNELYEKLKKHNESAQQRFVIDFWPTFEDEAKTKLKNLTIRYKNGDRIPWYQPFLQQWTKTVMQGLVQPYQYLSDDIIKILDQYHIDHRVSKNQVLNKATNKYVGVMTKKGQEILNDIVKISGNEVMYSETYLPPTEGRKSAKTRHSLDERFRTAQQYKKEGLQGIFEMYDQLYLAYQRDQEYYKDKGFMPHHYELALSLVQTDGKIKVQEVQVPRKSLESRQAFEEFFTDKIRKQDDFRLQAYELDIEHDYYIIKDQQINNVGFTDEALHDYVRSDSFVGVYCEGFTGVFSSGSIQAVRQSFKSFHYQLNAKQPQDSKINCFIWSVKVQIDKFKRKQYDSVEKLLNGLKPQQNNLQEITKILEIKLVVLNDRPCVDENRKFISDSSVIYEEEDVTQKELFQDQIQDLIQDPDTAVILLKQTYFDLHAIPVEDVLKPKPQTNSKKLDKMFLAIDFETISEPGSGEMIPYSCSVTEPIHMKKDQKQVITPGARSFSELQDMKNYLVNLMCDKSKQFVVFTFNGAKFDNQIILKLLAERIQIINNSNIKKRARRDDYINVVENRLNYMKIENIQFIDLARFMPGISLANLAKAFNTELKKDETFNHHDIQLEAHKNGLDWVKRVRAPEIKEYNELDVKVTIQIAQIFAQNIVELLDTFPFDYMTGPQMMYKMFKLYVDSQFETQDQYGKTKKGMTWFLTADRKQEETFRKAVIGGRCQAFQTGVFEGYFTMLDFVSQYPSRMLQCDYGFGGFKQTDEYVPGKHGIYHVDIIQQPRIKYIPFRDEKKNLLDWDYEDPFKAVLSAIDIKNMKKIGCEFEVKEGWYQPKKVQGSYLFAIIENLKKEKMQIDYYKVHEPEKFDPARRQIIKILINSLFGKCIQKMYYTEKFILSDYNDHGMRQKYKTFSIADIINGYFKDETEIFIGKGVVNEKRLKPLMPSTLGGQILAHSRAQLYNILKRVDVLYTDTDSAILSKDDYLKLKNQQPQLFGDDFGQLQLEFEPQKCKIIIIAKKLYYIENEKGEILKSKIKGIALQKDIYLGYENPQEYENSSYYDFIMLQRSRPPNNIQQIYHDLYTHKKVYFLTQQIQRNLDHTSMITNIGVRTVTYEESD